MQIFVGGKLTRVDGTSAATPSFAALVTLVNAERARNGKVGRAGWINPALYLSAGQAAEAAFNDVIDGNNRCTEFYTNKSNVPPAGLVCCPEANAPCIEHVCAACRLPTHHPHKA